MSIIRANRWETVSGNAAGVIYVDTIDDLKSLPTSELVDGQAAIVQGCEYLWDATDNKWTPTSTVNVAAYPGYGTPSGNVDAFEAARAEGVPVEIHGEFEIDRSLILSSSTHVIHLYGRITNSITMEEPLVRFAGQYSLFEGKSAYASIIGRGVHGGHFDETLNGIVNFGPINRNLPKRDVLWNRLENVRVAGDGELWARYNSTDQDFSIEQQIGIAFFSGQAIEPVGSGGTYLNHVNNVDFRNLGTAVKFARVGQLNTVTNVKAYRITWALFWMDGSNESNISMVNCHTAPGVVGVRTTRTPDDPFKINVPEGKTGIETSVVQVDSGGVEYNFTGRASNHNHVYGLMMEPGPGSSVWTGRNTRFVQLEEDGGSGNTIIGLGNTGHAYRDYNGENNVFSSNVDFRFGSRVSAPEFIVRDAPHSLNANRDRLNGYGKTRKVNHYSLGEERYVLAKAIVPERSIRRYKITFLSGSQSSGSDSRYTVAVMEVSVTRPLGGAVNIQLLSSMGKTATGLTILEPEVVGPEVRFGVRSRFESRRVAVIAEEYNYRVVNVDDATYDTLELLESPEISTQADFSISQVHRFGVAPIAHTDNLTSLGNSSNRWSEVFAANGTINTSDAREKQQQRGLSQAEQAVAEKIKPLMRMYKWNHAVDKKGGAARWHIGVMAQDVGDAFRAEGLDPHDYGVFCYDQWGVEDEDGIVAEVEGDRYGLRYDQLLAFVVSAL